MIKLSIITICYNSERHVRRCLRSVVPHLNESTEYIIIDGASTDNTLKIIDDECKDSPFVKVYSEPDNGLYDAMNKGLKRATGEYVYYINSDDAVAGGAVAKMIAAIDFHPSADCIYGNCEVVEFDDEGNEKCIKVWYGDKNIENLQYGMICSHQAIMCKREKMLKAGSFYTRLKIAADWDLILRMYKNGYRFQYIDMVFAKFSRGGVSTNNNHEWERHLVRKRNKTYGIIDNEYIKYLKTRLHDMIIK